MGCVWCGCYELSRSRTLIPRAGPGFARPDPSISSAADTSWSISSCGRSAGLVSAECGDVPADNAALGLYSWYSADEADEWCRCGTGERDEWVERVDGVGPTTGVNVGDGVSESVISMSSGPSSSTSASSSSRCAGRNSVCVVAASESCPCCALSFVMQSSRYRTYSIEAWGPGG